MRHGISDAELLQANKLLETNVVASIKAAFKRGGHVKSMGKAKRGGGAAKR